MVRPSMMPPYLLMRRYRQHSIEMEEAGSPITGQGQVDAYSRHTPSTGDKFQDPEWMPETVDSTEPSIHYVFPHTYIHTLPLKGSTYGFSLEYPHCHHHYSSALGPLLCKIRVT